MMTTTESENETAREQITNTVRDRPWATQQEVADEVDSARSWVAEVVADDPDLEAIREAYRKGLDLEADPETLRRLADAVELNVDGSEAVAERLRTSAEFEDVDRVRVEITPIEGGGDR